jgi:hypothetical protein
MRLGLRRDFCGGRSSGDGRDGQCHRKRRMRGVGLGATCWVKGGEE